MKKVRILLMVVLLTVCSVKGICASQVTGASPDVDNYSNVISDSGLVSTDSMQFMYAKLQLANAENAKNQVLNEMEDVEKLQQEQKQISTYLNEAREAQAVAKSSDKSTEMSENMKKYMDDNGLAYDTSDNDCLHTDEEWNVAIDSLMAHLNKIGLQIQTRLVYMQDFIGQYNSYLQGVDTQISHSNQTLTGLARGQSMYGDSSVGLTATALVSGLILGCCITLVVQKLMKRKVRV